MPEIGCYGHLHGDPLRADSAQRQEVPKCSLRRRRAWSETSWFCRAKNTGPRESISTVYGRRKERGASIFQSLLEGLSLLSAFPSPSSFSSAPTCRQQHHLITSTVTIILMTSNITITQETPGLQGRGWPICSRITHPHSSLSFIWAPLGGSLVSASVHRASLWNPCCLLPVFL